MRILLAIVILFSPLLAINTGHTINFNKVSALEFVKFVSRICETNFIFDEKDLEFEVSLVSGRPATPENILTALEQILEKNGVKMGQEDDYYLLEKMTENDFETLKRKHTLKGLTKLSQFVAGETGDRELNSPFHVYKLQYNEGSEILTAIKQFSQAHTSPHLANSITSLQYIKSTNSLLYTGDGIVELTALIQSLDKPQKQVFIEVLVIETSVKDGLEFGLEWAGKGKVLDKLGFGFGNFPPGKNNSEFAENFRKVSPGDPPTGNSLPFGKGFDLGVIGDIILHKGKTFFNLGSLVSALQRDGTSTIILNQKILTQDNKTSSIFVGDNIPFTGSVVTTVGASQQTTANIEYRDVGVSLQITPLLGDDNVITLDVVEEISEAREDLHNQVSEVSGILTSKTNMSTRAHVPDEHFLVLSGMIRNSKIKQKSGIPCLGGLPLIGAAFSKTRTLDEKRNVIIFVRPQIINSVDKYKEITKSQVSHYEKEGDKEALEEGLQTADASRESQ
jgi:type II secretory pathway component GspD/PulD (secretin)